jgi:hypothetical protein
MPPELSPPPPKSQSQTLRILNTPLLTSRAIASR